MCSLAFFFIWKLMKEKRYQKRNMQQFLRIIDNTTLQLFHKKNIVQDFLMYNEFDPKHYKGK